MNADDFGLTSGVNRAIIEMDNVTQQNAALVEEAAAAAGSLQDQAASSAVTEERLRIARELHDVVAHSMTVIAVQAGYGKHVIDAQPAQAREALGAIQGTSREALAEMRRMLGVLRQSGPEPYGKISEPGANAATVGTQRNSSFGWSSRT